jgi:PEP-CTERM motif
MKKLNKLGFAGVAAAALFALGFAATAQAQLISLTAGDFTINANGYSGAALPTNGFVAPGRLPVVGGPPGQLEDSRGIFQINNITQGSGPGATTVYTSNLPLAAGVFQYYGVFYNAYDTSSVTVGTTTIFQSQGLLLDIYALAVNDVGDAYWTTVFNQGSGVGERIGGAAGYDGITNVGGSLVLRANLIGTSTGTFESVSQTTFNGGLLNVSLNSLFGTAGLNLSPLTYALAGVTNNVPTDWSVSFGGPITGNVIPVPEPSTYGLIAAGALLGLVAFRRMKIRAQAV